MRTAAHEVSKFFLRSTTQVKTKRTPTSHFSVHGFLHCAITPLKVCLAVTNPSKDEDKPRHRISPCMDVASWTIVHTHFPISIHEADTVPCQRRSKIRHRNSPYTDQTSPSKIRRRISPCMHQTSPFQRRSKIRHRISPCTDQTCVPIPVARHIFFADARCVQVHSLMPSSTPSSEDDVLSRPAKKKKETMTPSSVAAAEQSAPIPVDEGVTYHHKASINAVHCFWRHPEERLTYDSSGKRHPQVTFSRNTAVCKNQDNWRLPLSLVRKLDLCLDLRLRQTNMYVPISSGSFPQVGEYHGSS